MKRTLLISERLPEYDTSSQRTACLHLDVRDARDSIQRKLTDVAARYHASGWVDDPDGITYDVLNSRTVMGKLVITRPD